MIFKLYYSLSPLSTQLAAVYEGLAIKQVLTGQTRLKIFQGTIIPLLFFGSLTLDLMHENYLS